MDRKETIILMGFFLACILLIAGSFLFVDSSYYGKRTNAGQEIVGPAFVRPDPNKDQGFIISKGEVYILQEKAIVFTGLSQGQWEKELEKDGWDYIIK
jgi:hypothetical protein